MSAKKKQSSAIVAFFTSKIFLISIVCVILVVTYGLGRSVYQDYMLRQEIFELQQNIRSLETKNIKSLEILGYVMSDAFVEREARQSLNLQEPGEKVFVFPNTDSNTEEVVIGATLEENRPLLNNPMKWWYYFIHKDIHN
jgi:cell division protein FtsB